MEASFKKRLEHVQEEFAKELNDATEIMKAQHKRELGKFQHRRMVLTLSDTCFDQQRSSGST